MAASGSETETSVLTEPSAGDAYRAAYEPYRVAARDPGLVGAFRQWWAGNPLHNLWGPKPNSWQTFQKVAAGQAPDEAVKSGAHVSLSDIVR